jgi:hypothetical protein
MVSIAIFSGKNAATGRTFKMNIQQDAEKTSTPVGKMVQIRENGTGKQNQQPKHQDFHRF